MATIIGVGMQMTASAAGMTKGLSEAERAIRSLQNVVKQAGERFKAFADQSELAARKQQQFATDVAFLSSAMRTGQVTKEQYRAEIAKLVTEAGSLNDALQRGAEITRQYALDEQERADKLAEISRLLRQDVIDQETALRARADITGETQRLAEEAAAAEQERARQVQRASEIIQANLTSEQRARQAFEAEAAELNRLRSVGLLQENDYAIALDRVAKQYAKATTEAASFGQVAEDAGEGSVLRFNELTGILAALPGPLGSIAGRISGLSSAGQGLSRVFAGGLKQGISSVGTAVAGLVNPFTISAGAIAGLGLAARNVSQNLIALQGRVQSLGNTADKLGISFEFVQTLDEAARRGGISIETISAAFQRLQKSVLGVDEESVAAQKALAGIGVTAEQLQALKPEDQYLLIGQRLASIENPAKRTVAALNLFGKSGADLIPFFRSIGPAAADLERVGAALSTGQRQDVESFGAAMDRLSVAAKGAGEQISVSFAPVGKTIANALAEASGAVAKFVEDQNKAATFTRELQELQSGLFDRRATDEERALIASGRTAEEVLARVEARAQIFRETGRFVGLTDALIETALAGNRAAGAVEQVAAAADQIQQLSEKSQESLDRAIERVAEYGQAGFDATLKYQEGLREIDALVAENELTEQQATRARRNATAEYDQQIAIIKQNVDEKNKAADESKKAADRELDAIQSIIDKTAERARVEREFGGDEARARNDADLQRIRDAIAETEAVIAKARDAGNAQQIATAASRLAELDQTRAALEASQEDFARAAEFAAQGFADGFREAFAATDEDISKLIDKAGEFGQAGFAAALQLQDGIREAQSLVEEGLYTREAYERDVERQQRLFEDRIAQLEQAAQKQKELDEKLAEDRRRINEFVDQQLALQAFGGDSGRLEASRRVLEIEAEIARVEAEQQAARQANDQSAVRAASTRLAQLDQVAAKERDIATGAVQAREEAEKRLQEQQDAYAKAQEDQQKQIQQAQQQFQQELARQQQAEYERQVKRITDLNTLGERQVNTADVRTQEGAALVLNLAANAQDPALIEARLQSKYLRLIDQSIREVLQQAASPTVTITGGALDLVGARYVGRVF